MSELSTTSLRKKAVPIKFEPIHELHWQRTLGLWQATSSSATFEAKLDIEAGIGRWVLISGILRCRGPRQLTCLRIDVLGNVEPISIRLPVSGKGKVLEIIYLPANWHRICMQPLCAEGFFEVNEWYVTPIGLLERSVRRLRRMIPIYHKLPRAMRRRLGFKVSSFFAYTPLVQQVMDDIRDACQLPVYSLWIQRFHDLREIDRQFITKHISKWHHQPVFKIIVTGQTNDAAITKTLNSIHRQIYRKFQIIRCTEARELSALIQRQADNLQWCLILTAGTCLAEHALYWLAYEARRFFLAELIYTDHDYYDSHDNRSNPNFKPDWSLELLRSVNYINNAIAVRVTRLSSIASIVGEEIYHGLNHQALLLLAELIESEKIRHIPAPLWHFPICYLNTTMKKNDKLLIISRHLQRSGVEGKVIQHLPGYYRIRYAIPKPLPKVSIIIPTRDAFRYLSTCVESVLKFTTYKNYELVIIDNQTTEAKARAYIDGLRLHQRIRVLPYDEEFNYAAINNWAANQVDGDVLCLLNNDTEIITPDWLEEMLGYLVQPKVGIVGAKLYFRDGRVQHAGDVVGVGGCAAHLNFKLQGNEPGYCHRAVLAQDLSAVTGACLVTWRELYYTLNGLDAANLPVAFNDVDYCLRVKKAGYRIIWTPHAQLYHHESISRGKDKTRQQKRQSKSEAAYFRYKWHKSAYHDPFYNPNLNYDYADFSLSRTPRVNYPWWC